MKKFLSVTATALLIAGLTSGAASAKHRRHHVYPGQAYPSQRGWTGSPPPFFGSNAELMGNNGNSASGDNSLGHIKGGNSGAGK